MPRAFVESCPYAGVFGFGGWSWQGFLCYFSHKLSSNGPRRAAFPANRGRQTVCFFLCPGEPVLLWKLVSGKRLAPADRRPGSEQVLSIWGFSSLLGSGRPGGGRDRDGLVRAGGASGFRRG